MSPDAQKVKITYREAMRQAIRDALIRDQRVFLMGEDVGAYGGCYAVSRGLLEEFGPDRIRDTPLSESAFVGAGIGAAMNGMRPIVEIMTVNFSLLALDQIVNNAATILHMSGGQFNIPLVIRMTTGAGRQLAAQHSHSLEGWYAHIPGIKVLAPATLEDARGMLWTALEDPDPVLIFEHGTLYNMEGEMAVDAGDVGACGGNPDVAIDADDRIAIAPLAAPIVEDASTLILECDESLDVQPLVIHDRSRRVGGRDEHCAASDEESCRMLADGAEALNGDPRSCQSDLAKVLRDLGRDGESESSRANLIEWDSADFPR